MCVCVQRQLVLLRPDGTVPIILLNTVNLWRRFQSSSHPRLIIAPPPQKSPPLKPLLTLKSSLEKVIKKWRHEAVINTSLTGCGILASSQRPHVSAWLFLYFDICAAVLQTGGLGGLGTRRVGTEI